MSTVSRAYSNLRGIQTAWKDMGRVRQILGVLVQHGFGELVERLGVAPQEELPRGDGGAEAVGGTPVRIRRAIEALGPTFVKLGQILSTRSDIVAPDILRELQRLQDRVPPIPFAQVRERVEEALGGPLEEVFASFDEVPLASASIAQVHVATLPDDGGEVVVKVLRPGIAEMIQSDLHILHALAKRAEAMLPELELMDPVGIVTAFEKAMQRELDLSVERENLQRFRRLLEDMEGVHIPAVYPSHSTDTVLTLERIQGVKVTEAPARFGIDPNPLAKRMLRLLFTMVFRDGFFHGDLHPGNILIREDGVIALIDFGLVGRLTPPQRDRILEVLIGIAEQDYARVSRVYFELGVKVPGVFYDYDLFESDVTELMEKHIAAKTLSEIDVGAFFTELVAGCLRHRIKMPPTYTMVFKGLVTVEGIGRSMAPDVNLIEEAEPFVRDMVQSRYQPEKLMSEGLMTLEGLRRFLHVFPLTSAQLLRDMALGKLVTRTEVHNLDTLVAVAERQGVRVTRGLIGAGGMVAGALTVQVGADALLGVSVVAWAFWVLAAICILPLLGPLLRGK